jgi:ubiquinone/menaquinone biosynthesis C-methylase UbiE
MLKEIADEFDKWAAAGRAESMALGHQSVTFQMLEMISFNEKMVVADVGCGNGWAVEEMLQRGAGSGYGFDVSNGMVELARQGGSVRSQYTVASGSEMPLEDQSIDFLLSVESLYYHPKPIESVSEWKRVLRKGGKVGVMVDLYLENKATHTWIDALSIPVHLLSIADYCALFQQAGFRKISHEQIQNKMPIKALKEFQESAYWPSYEMYLSYRETGSLVIWAEK